jgi:hypothetical protein
MTRVRIPALAVVLALLAACVAPSLLTVAAGFTVMTWNVRGYPETTAARREWFSDVIAAYPADILCVQEIASEVRVRAFLADEVGYHESAFLDSSDARDNAIFFVQGVLDADVADPQGFRPPVQVAYVDIDGFTAHVMTVNLVWTNQRQRNTERQLLGIVAEDLLDRDGDLIVAGSLDTTAAAGETIERLADAMGLEVLHPENGIGAAFDGSQRGWILVSPSVASTMCICTEIIALAHPQLTPAVADRYLVRARFETRIGPCPPCLPPPATPPFVPACACAGPDLDCADFECQPDAQRCYEHCLSEGYGDVFGLDADDDGTACEHLSETCP